MQTSTFQLVLHAGLFVKAILLILFGFSVVSWTIIVYKYLYFRAASTASAALLAAFEPGHDLDGALDAAKALDASPLANLLTAVYSGRGRSRPPPPTASGLPRPPASGGFPGSVAGEVSLTLRRQEALELEKLHHLLAFLATTGSTAPFIGLLWTVWGIMDAFQEIGASGSASLAVVAPGIAEALITTAAGLATAIPAVMAYNVYVGRARKMAVQLEAFSDTLNALLSKKTA